MPEQIRTGTRGLIDRARGLRVRPGRTLLGITGAPGAGKSTLAQALVSALGTSAALVPMDGFHLDNPLLGDLGLRGRKGAPETFDVGGYAALLRRLGGREEGTVYAPRFDRSREIAIAAAIAVPPEAGLIVTEGNYLLHTSGGWEEVAGLLDEVWFLDVDPARRRERLIRRRLMSGEIQTTAARWVDEVDAANARVVEATKARADLIIDLE